MWNKCRVVRDRRGRVLRGLEVFSLLAVWLIGGQPAGAQGIFNGSFETAYAGWNLSEAIYGPGFVLDPPGSLWGIGVSGETLDDGVGVLDHHDGIVVDHHTTPSLPITWLATDGSAVAFHLQSQSGHNRLWQDLVLPGDATHLTWDMAYNNHLGLFDSFLGENHLAVSLRNPADGSLLGELFRTVEGSSPHSIPMTTFSAGIAAFAGQPVRIQVELKNLWSFDLVLDDFVVLPTSGGGDGTPPSDDPPTAGIEIQVRDSINPRSRGVVAVGILGRPTFDPSTGLDRSTIVSGTATPVHGGHTADLNGDGYLDLLVHFEVQRLALAEGDALRATGGSGELCVLGMTMDEEPVEACTSVGLTGGATR